MHWNKPIVKKEILEAVRKFSKESSDQPKTSIKIEEQTELESVLDDGDKIESQNELKSDLINEEHFKQTSQDNKILETDGAPAKSNDKKDKIQSNRPRSKIYNNS